MLKRVTPFFTLNVDRKNKVDTTRTSPMKASKENAQREIPKNIKPKTPTMHLHNQTLRDFQYSIQMCSMFVFGTLVGYCTSYASTLSALDSQWIIPVFGTVLITDTVGMTLLSSLVGILNFIPECIYVYVLQYCGMGYQDYLSSTLFFFLIIFIIGFCNPNIAIRKISMVIPAVLFVELVTTPSQYIDLYLVWNMLGASLISMSICIATSICVYPRFACLETQDRLVYSLYEAGYVFESINQAMLATNPATASEYLSESDVLIENMKANQISMSARIIQSKLEPKMFLRSHFRSHHILFNKLTIPELGEISSAILWHLTSAIHAVRNIRYNKTHAYVLTQCKESFIKINQSFLYLTELLTTESSKIPHNTIEINSTLLELKKHGDNISHILAAALLNMAEKQGDISIHNKITFSTPTHTHNNHTNNNVNTNATTTNSNMNNQNDSLYIETDDDVHDIHLDFDHTSSPINNSMTFSFYIFHISEIIKLMDCKFYTTPSTTTSNANNTQGKNEKNDTMTNNDENINSDKNNDKNIEHTNNSIKKEIPKKISLLTKLKIFFKRYGWEYGMNGFKACFYVGVALIFCEVPYLEQKFEHGKCYICTCLYMCMYVRVYSLCTFIKYINIHVILVV